MQAIRVYADTSVFGGVFDTEFQAASSAFCDEVRSGRLQLVTSLIVADEIEPAPEHVRKLFDEMLNYAEVHNVTEEMLQLRDAYLRAEIVSPRWSEDALHVAIATVLGCSLLISWNFRHIVHFSKNSALQCGEYPEWV